MTQQALPLKIFELPLQTLILGENMKLSGAPNIISFGHIDVPGSPVIYLYLFQVTWGERAFLHLYKRAQHTFWQAIGKLPILKTDLCQRQSKSEKLVLMFADFVCLIRTLWYGWQHCTIRLYLVIGWSDLCQIM